ncbi:hypothetical protein DdX_18115 [Ditylenchus destructor]|uniref:Uncharacterized protein n=1 Tax=Ditylenchus destructor TaxID=166010 RepID=A0AAD4QYD5_9BILA|nr:hypothetical protein DdX_18115 [Ditylenchus destructor]
MGAFSSLSTILIASFIVYLLLSFDSSIIEAKKGKGGGGGGNEQEEPVPAEGGQPVMHCCASNRVIGCSDQVCTHPDQCNGHLFRKQCRV